MMLSIWLARWWAEGRPSPVAMTTLASAAEPDEPDLPGGPPAAAGAAVVDRDVQAFAGLGVGVAVGLGAAGRVAVEPGPAAGVADDWVRAAGAGARPAGRVLNNACRPGPGCSGSARCAYAGSF